MKNINSLIVSYNKSILRPKATEYGCNSRKKESCPLQNQCLTPKHIGVVNEATMVNNSDDEKRVYFGASDTTVKNNIATIHEILVTNATLNVQSY